MQDKNELRRILSDIYGDKVGRRALDQIWPLIENCPKRQPSNGSFFSPSDIVLITYGDTLVQPTISPLETLFNFVSTYLKHTVSTIHFLPFFPFSSDDGFSVIDFFKINPILGDWEDIQRFRSDFKLMFDFVINHFSAESEWLQKYLQNHPDYADFAIEIDPSTDLSQVIRPRSLPLLTAFQKTDGRQVSLWTTFSSDQIDFNYASLNVLRKMIEVLLFYVLKGAQVLRLDAIAYLWKEVGTPCIHLPQTHAMVKLFRKILDIVAPEVVIITETNVPHPENISYFGHGRDEAQMVYNFTLPPLLFYSFLTENTSVFSNWARTLVLDSADTTFFNFTASHDGIGVRPLEGILPAAEINKLITAVKANGGYVSYKHNPDGSQSPYELNITYVDALLGSSPQPSAAKFLASQAIQYVLPGMPATYIHSLLGSRNWEAGVRKTGRVRTINREKIPLDELLIDLQNPRSFRSRIFYPYLKLMQIRAQQAAFHPNAGFEIMELIPEVFAIKRTADSQEIYALTNISAHPVSVSLASYCSDRRLHDLLTGHRFDTHHLKLAAYQYVWLVV